MTGARASSAEGRGLHQEGGLPHGPRCSRRSFLSTNHLAISGGHTDGVLAVLRLHCKTSVEARLCETGRNQGWGGERRLRQGRMHAWPGGRQAQAWAVRGGGNRGNHPQPGPR